MVFGNQAELNQVLINLLSNSVDAVQDVANARIEVKAYRREGNIVVEISDNGPGIPVDIRKKIFEPFFTTKSPGKGTGLGLFIAQSVVKKHGGSIEINSDNLGAHSKITLPEAM
jgi:C4-dicarboxylate-specific signal transduction histidine kinase